LDGLKHLEKAGAEFLAIACNTVHMYYPRLASAVSVPLLNIVELAVAEIPRSSRRVALLAARPTADSGFFQEAMRAAGQEVVELDWQNTVDSLLSAVRDTTDPEVFAMHWGKLLPRARVADVNAVLVACLDLSAILRFAPVELPLVDAANCLARAAVRKWLVGRSADR